MAKNVVTPEMRPVMTAAFGSVFTGGGEGDAATGRATGFAAGLATVRAGCALGPAPGVPPPRLSGFRDTEAGPGPEAGAGIESPSSNGMGFSSSDPSGASPPPSEKLTRSKLSMYLLLPTLTITQKEADQLLIRLYSVILSFLMRVSLATTIGFFIGARLLLSVILRLGFIWIL